MTKQGDLNRGHFTCASWLFLRLLALVHLIAFVSFWVQLDGLVGPHGISPASRYFAALREQLGPAAYAQLPSLCWLFGSGPFLHVVCAGGVVVSLLLFAGVAPPLCLALLWAGYLTVCSAGQVFFNFQWDALLLEATLLAIFVAPWSWRPLWRRAEPPWPARLLLWWLLWRLMFLGGIVKLTSGDTAWRDLSALTFHFETQPLPTPLAWHAHQLPAWWHRAECAGMFVLELFVPCFLFAPRALRHNAALLLAAFMGAVALTGNYTFFNVLAIALCLACLDDAWWAEVVPARLFQWSRGALAADGNDRGEGAAAPTDSIAAVSRWQRWFAGGFAALAFGYTALQALPVCLPALGEPPGLDAVARFVAPLRSFNNYGLFAVMTRPRPELIFEGSDDGRTWRAYEFPHKPGDLACRPTWVAPHQPRLDWQLWFAALGSLPQNPWCLALCEHLLRGTPEVLALLAKNPFPGKPPRYVRIVRYEYHFTDAAARRRSGQWWRRTPLEIYLPPASLREP